MPLLEIVAMAEFMRGWHETPSSTPSEFQKTFFDVIELSICVLFVITGAYLIASVTRIRQAYNQIAVEALNTRNMALHASAFGLFLISSVVVTITQTLQIFFTESPKIYKVYNVTYYFYLFANFFSQALLCVIFKDLGKKENLVSEQDDAMLESVSSASSVKVDEFDEEAQLQAQIWNQFEQRTALDDSERAMTYVSHKALVKSMVSTVAMNET